LKLPEAAAAACRAPRSLRQQRGRSATPQRPRKTRVYLGGGHVQQHAQHAIREASPALHPPLCLCRGLSRKVTGLWSLVSGHWSPVPGLWFSNQTRPDQPRPNQTKPELQRLPAPVSLERGGTASPNELGPARSLVSGPWSLGTGLRSLVSGFPTRPNRTNPDQTRPNPGCSVASGAQARGYFIYTGPAASGAANPGHAATPTCLHTPGGALHLRSPIGY